MKTCHEKYVKWKEIWDEDKKPFMKWTKRIWQKKSETADRQKVY